VSQKYKLKESQKNSSFLFHPPAEEEFSQGNVLVAGALAVRPAALFWAFSQFIPREV